MTVLKQPTFSYYQRSVEVLPSVPQGFYEDHQNRPSHIVANGPLCAEDDRAPPPLRRHLGAIEVRGPLLEQNIR